MQCQMYCYTELVAWSDINIIKIANAQTKGKFVWKDIGIAS